MYMCCVFVGFGLDVVSGMFILLLWFIDDGCTLSLCVVVNCYCSLFVFVLLLLCAMLLVSWWPMLLLVVVCSLVLISSCCL